MIKVRKQSDGTYIDESDCPWDFEEYLIEDILGFCGCGKPSEVVPHILFALLFIAEKDTFNDNRELYDDWNKRVSEYFHNNEGFKYLIWYVLDKAGLTEHGGSVPGWLTEKGYEVLELIKYWDSESDEDIDKLLDDLEQYEN